MIVYRIWEVDRYSAKSGLRMFGDMDSGRERGALRFAIRVVIESGAIYTGSVFMFFVTFLASNNAQYLASHAVSHQTTLV